MFRGYLRINRILSSFCYTHCSQMLIKIAKDKTKLIKAIENGLQGKDSIKH